MPLFKYAPGADDVPQSPVPILEVTFASLWRVLNIANLPLVLPRSTSIEVLLLDCIILIKNCLVAKNTANRYLQTHR